MPQFIYRLQPTRSTMLAEGPTDREARIVDQHFDYFRLSPRNERIYDLTSAWTGA